MINTIKWSESAWSASRNIYEQIIASPFVKELMSGTLPSEKFAFYMEQDALYLSKYGRVLAAIASKLENSEDVNAFLSFAKDTVVMELQLHTDFIRKTSKPTEPSPTCLLYTSYLMHHMAVASVEVIAAAVLPCFWIYKKVGDYILANQSGKNNPYQVWIDTYGGVEFAEAVDKAIDICDRLASACMLKKQEEMTRAFVMSSKMEWMFWDSAWCMEEWKI